MSVKIQGVPDGYELVRIGAPKKGEAFIGACSSVVHAPQDFCSGNYAIVRKITPQVRPMTRDEFLSAWKQRNFCPLIDSDDGIDTVLYVVVDNDDDDQDIISLNYNGWKSLDDIANYKFASDNSPLTVEE